MSAFFVGFAKYRYGAQSDHHGNAEEDLDVGTSRDLVDWAAFDMTYVYMLVRIDENEEGASQR